MCIRDRYDRIFPPRVLELSNGKQVLKYRSRAPLGVLAVVLLTALSVKVTGFDMGILSLIHIFFPKGDEEEPTEEGLAFYEGVFRECKKYGIEPLVTITHFDCPMHLIKTYGGWKDRRLIEFYKKLVTTLFTRYKGLVKYWITFNEINMILHLPFMGAGLQFEEGEDQEQAKYVSAHHELVASAWATKIAHEIDPENKLSLIHI